MSKPKNLHQDVVNPWSDGQELIQAHDCIYKNKDLEWLIFARNKLTIWLTRIPHSSVIAVPISSTHSILNAKIEFAKFNNDDLSCCGSNIHSLFGMAIIRFCNTIESYQKYDNSIQITPSITKLATKYSCPQWIIECRHSLCHTTPNQPSLEQLCSAADIALDWLDEYFWQKELAKVSNQLAYSSNHIHKLLVDYFDYSILKSKSNKEDKTMKNIKVKAGQMKKQDSVRKQEKNKMLHNLSNILRDNRSEFNKALIELMIKDHSKKWVISEKLILKAHLLLRYQKLLCNKQMHLFSLLNSLSNHNRLKSESKVVRHVSASILACLVQLINKSIQFPNQSKLFNDKPINEKDWLHLLYRVAKCCSEYTVQLVDLIHPFVGQLMSEKKKEQLINLLHIWNNDDDPGLSNNLDKTIDLTKEEKSVNDLIVEVKRKHGRDLVLIEEDNEDINDGINWTDLCIGSSIYTHLSENHDASQSETNQSETNQLTDVSEQNIIDLT